MCLSKNYRREWDGWSDRKRKHDDDLPHCVGDAVNSNICASHFPLLPDKNPGAGGGGDGVLDPATEASHSPACRCLSLLLPHASCPSAYLASRRLVSPIFVFFSLCESFGSLFVDEIILFFFFLNSWSHNGGFLDLKLVCGVRLIWRFFFSRWYFVLRARGPGGFKELKLWRQDERLIHLDAWPKAEAFRSPVHCIRSHGLRLFCPLGWLLWYGLLDYSGHIAAKSC